MNNNPLPCPIPAGAQSKSPEESGTVHRKQPEVKKEVTRIKEYKKAEEKEIPSVFPDHLIYYNKIIISGPFWVLFIYPSLRIIFCRSFAILGRSFTSNFHSHRTERG